MEMRGIGRGWRIGPNLTCITNEAAARHGDVATASFGPERELADSAAGFFSASDMLAGTPAMAQRQANPTSSLCQWRPGRELFFWCSCLRHALNHQVFCRMNSDFVVNASNAFFHGPTAERELVGDLSSRKPKQ